MNYKIAAEHKLSQDEAEYVNKIRVRNEESFIASTSSSGKPISLFRCSESDIIETISFLPPRHNSYTSRHPGKNREMIQTQKILNLNSKGFPSCGPTDFSFTFSCRYPLQSGLRFPMKRGNEEGDKQSGENFIATCYRSGMVSIYDIRTNRPVAVMTDICTENETHCIEMVNFRTRNGEENSIFSSSEQTHVLVGDGSAVRIVDLRKLSVVDSIEYHNDIVTDIKTSAADASLFSQEEALSSRYRLLTSSEDGALILSTRNLESKVEYESCISLGAPLRKIANSAQGNILVNTSIEELFYGNITIDYESDVLSLNKKHIFKRFNADAYIADIFWASGIDFSKSLDSMDVIFEMPIFFIGHHGVAETASNADIGMYISTDESPFYSQYASLPGLGRSLVRTIQPFPRSGQKPLDNLLSGDETGCITLWRR